MSTLELLRAQFDTVRPTVDQVMAKYFPHISSRKHFLREVKTGRIKLPVHKAYDSRKAPYVVQLADLATFLDAQTQSNTTAADQAA
jgi:hypothetical protein